MSNDGASLDTLVSAIETLQKRIRRDHATIGANEARTRKELIDPLLTALGWDDSSVVTLEYLVRYGPGENDYRVADYALHAPGRRAQPFAFIEAKRMREDLTDEHREQAFTYADIRANATHVVLTNGDCWEFYEAREDHFRCILEFSIRDEPARNCAELLLPLERNSGGLDRLGRSQSNDLSPSPSRGGVAGPERRAENRPASAVDWQRALSWSALTAFGGIVTGYVVGFRAADPIFDEVYGVVGAAVVVVLIGLGAFLLLPRLPWRLLPWRWLWPIVGDLRKTLVALSGGAVVGGAIGGGLGYAAGTRTAQLVYDALAGIGLVALVAALILIVALVVVASGRGSRRRRRGYRSRRYSGRRR